MDMNEISLKDLADIRDFLARIAAKNNAVVGEYERGIRKEGGNERGLLRVLRSSVRAQVAQVSDLYASDMLEKISAKDSKATPQSILNYCLQECHPEPGQQSTSMMATVEKEAVLAFYISIAKFITGNGEFF